MATTCISMIPKDVFERGIIRMTKGGIITMPDKDVWMTVDEIADMLFRFISHRVSHDTLYI